MTQTTNRPATHAPGVAAALASLTIPQAVAVSTLVESIGARACIRDVLCHRLRDLLGVRGSAKADARKLASRLADPGEGAHAEVLRTVNALSRHSGPLTAARIERILVNVERKAVA